MFPLPATLSKHVSADYNVGCCHRPSGELYMIHFILFIYWEIICKYISLIKNKMNWLRKIVSGKRNRFNDDTFDLDVTYITQWVLAMSFPASGFETIYRNSITDVRLKFESDHTGSQLPERETSEQFHCHEHEWEGLRREQVRSHRQSSALFSLAGPPLTCTACPFLSLLKDAWILKE